MERLRRVNADLVEAIEIAIDRLETVIAGADVCANCVDVAIRNMRAALRSATETPGGGSDVSPVSDGSNRDSKPSATETKGEPLCPRPANSAPPGPVTVRECVARSECGCDEMKGYPT
jgi:hypothetical protein